MTEIDFYLLGEGESRVAFAIRLCSKIFGLGHSIFISTETEEHSQSLSKQLWQFQSGSFLANEVLLVSSNPSESLESKTPIKISHNICEQSAPLENNDVLINLGVEIPPHFSRFKRHVEIIGDDDSVKEKLRNNYRFYQQRGYPLKLHQLGEK
jgi:DNA polymerase-3 subunit chi